MGIFQVVGLGGSCRCADRHGQRHRMPWPVANRLREKHDSARPKTPPHPDCQPPRPSPRDWLRNRLGKGVPPPCLKEMNGHAIEPSTKFANNQQPRSFPNTIPQSCARLCSRSRCRVVNPPTRAEDLGPLPNLCAALAAAAQTEGCVDRPR